MHTSYQSHWHDRELDSSVLPWMLLDNQSVSNSVPARGCLSGSALTRGARGLVCLRLVHVLHRLVHLLVLTLLHNLRAVLNLHAAWSVIFGATTGLSEDQRRCSQNTRRIEQVGQSQCKRKTSRVSAPHFAKSQLGAQCTGAQPPNDC